MKLSLASLDIVVGLSCDTARSVKVGKAFGVEPERYPYLFAYRWRENWSIAVIQDLTTGPQELFNLFKCTGHETVDGVWVTRREFESTINKVGYQIRWCTEKILRLEPINFANSGQSVAHTQS